MKGTYSVDLRLKVISFIMGGRSKREAARVFNIGEDTVYRWLRLHKAGDIRPKERTVYPCMVDVAKLREYVEKNPDQTIIEIGAGLQLGRQTVFRWLKRLGITRKKRRRCTGSAAKKSVQATKGS